MGFVYYKNHFETRCHIFLPFLFHVVNKIKTNKIRFKVRVSFNSCEFGFVSRDLFVLKKKRKITSVFSSLIEQDSRPRVLYLLGFRISLLILPTLRVVSSIGIEKHSETRTRVFLAVQYTTQDQRSFINYGRGSASGPILWGVKSTYNYHLTVMFNLQLKFKGSLTNCGSGSINRTLPSSRDQDLSIEPYL